MNVYVVFDQKYAPSSLATLLSAPVPTGESAIVGVYEDELEALREASIQGRWIKTFELRRRDLREDKPDWWPSQADDAKWGGDTGWALHLVHCRPDRCEIGCGCPHHHATLVGAD